MDKKFKNVKVKEELHTQVKEVSRVTGINVGKLIEMGVAKVLEDFKAGFFDNIVTAQKRLRRDGTITRGE